MGDEEFADASQNDHLTEPGLGEEIDGESEEAEDQNPISEDEVVGDDSDD